MEALNRLVTDSLVRHGFDRPIDPRRLQWSRWYPCDSPRSLLVVPSKPGIFAIAEDVLTGNGRTAVLGCPAEQSSTAASRATTVEIPADRERRDLSRAVKARDTHTAFAAEANSSKRMLAVLQFSEADDMAFTLDRMLTRPNPMRERLSSGRCFLRFVALADEAQRHSICGALNQWMLSSAEKATGMDFLTAFADPRERTFSFGARTTKSQPAQSAPIDLGTIATPRSTGANKNHPQPLPSGF